MAKVKVKKYSEAEIVNMFANNDVRKIYNARGKIKDDLMDVIKKRLAQHCIYEYSKVDKTFNITEVYKIQHDLIYGNMHRGLYNYIIPLILHDIVAGYNKNNKVTMSVFDISKRIGISNNTYIEICNSRYDLSSCFSVDDYLIDSYVSRTNDRISYYINKAIEYLSEKRCILTSDTYKVKCCEEEEVKIYGVVRKINRMIYRQATSDEVAFISETIGELSDQFNCYDKYDRWYGENSKQYMIELKKRLKERGIIDYVKAYEMWTVKSSICDELYNSYIGEMSIEDIRSNVNKEFFLNDTSNCCADTDNKIETYDDVQKELNKIIISNDVDKVHDFIGNLKSRQYEFIFDIEGAQKGTIGWC